MILNFKGDDYPESIVSIDGEVIDNVKEFVYLGSLITNMNQVSLTLRLIGE